MNAEKSGPCESEDDEEEGLDPRVKFELEKLNFAADGVNHLETEYGEAQALFNQMHADAGMQLRILKQRLGKSVEKARPYYDTLRKARQAKTALHLAARQFESAQNRHDLARKKVTEAESRVAAGSGQINSEMQDMLNRANLEITEATKYKNECWKAHQLTAQIFEEEQKKLNELSKSLHKTINRSRPYFDLKMEMNKRLEEQKQRIENISVGIQVAKKEYGSTLLRLEKISNEIHVMRKMRKLNSVFSTPRGEGVGAESASEDETSLNNNNNGIRVSEFDEVSAFGDDDSIAASEQDSDSPSASSSSRANVFEMTESQNFTVERERLSSQGYDFIASSDVPTPLSFRDFLNDEVVLERRRSELFPNITKRWRSLNALETKKTLPIDNLEENSPARRSSLTLLLPRKTLGKARAKDIANPRSLDIESEYDIIDGQRIKISVDNAEDDAGDVNIEQRHPAEGCDSEPLVDTPSQEMESLAFQTTDIIKGTARVIGSQEPEHPSSSGVDS